MLWLPLLTRGRTPHKTHALSVVVGTATQINPANTKAHFLDIVDTSLASMRASYRHSADSYNETVELLDLASAEDRTLYNDILVDLPRTIMPGFKRMCTDKGFHKMLGRVIFIWAKRAGSIGYFQGLVDLAYTFLLCFLAEHDSIDGDYAKLARCSSSDFDPIFLRHIEADVFWCLTRLMDAMGVCSSIQHTHTVFSL